MLNVALWIAQVLVLLAFEIGAGMKIFFPIPRLANIWSWTGDVKATFVRGLGAVDLIGGVGVVLPMATGALAALTVLAALGCVMLQLCAIVFHLSRGEGDAVPVNITLLGLSAFICWGRWDLLA